MRVRQLTSCFLSLAIFCSTNATFAAVSPAAGKSSPEGAKNMQTPVKRVVRHQPPPLVEKYLQEGNLAEGEAASLAELKLHPKNDQARFGLGVLQFIRAVEGLAQGLYRYGVRSSNKYGLKVPFLRLPVPDNVQPETISYDKLRAVAQTVLTRLETAEQTLSGITDPNVKLPLHFGLIRLDINGDGRADESEMLWKMYDEINGHTITSEEQARSFEIAFDRGDVHWLRGYCHLLSALCDIYLAHDTKQMFESTAHLFFPRVDTPYRYLNEGTPAHRSRFNDDKMFDIVALVHLISWDCTNPALMTAALNHLDAVTAQSKESWKFIMAETDDDCEWLPNPRQTGVIPGAHVTDEMVTSWLEMMNEIHRILAGEVLLPFWRGDQPIGVNLRKVFTQPTRFDLVLWVQGTCAAPYLEKGPLTDKVMWGRLRSVFGGQFPGFAIWFN